MKGLAGGLGIVYPGPIHEEGELERVVLLMGLFTEAGF